MRRYQKAQGVSIPGGRKVILTPEGVAMGYIPDAWNTLMGPEFMRDNKIINRALPGENKRGVAQDNYDPGAYSFSSFPNGVLAFDYVRDPEDILRSLTSADINPDRWTVFVVQRPDAAPGRTRELLRTIDGTPGGEFSPRVGINSANERASIYNSSSDSTLRLGYTPPVSYDNRTVLLMFTFSIERGLAIFENGELGASAPNDTQPFTFGYGAGEVGWNRQMAGLVGMTGLLDIDLSAPENTGYRKSIENFLMDKYGISQ